MKLSVAFAAGLLAAAASLCAGFQLPMRMSSHQQPAQQQQPRRGDAVDRRSHAWGGAAVLAGAGAVLMGSPMRPARADVPEEGIDAPDFTLPSSLGKPLSLGELRKSGKYTVLYFFPQVFTSSECCVMWCVGVGGSNLRSLLCAGAECMYPARRLCVPVPFR